MILVKPETGKLFFLLNFDLVCSGNLPSGSRQPLLMLRVYISYAPADKVHLDTLLKWLQPLKDKYFLRIWHNPIPKPWAKYPYRWDEMVDQLEEAHIYLFLISYQSLAMSYIEQEEVPRAVARHIEHGDKYVRIFPVLVSPSQWKKHSGLAHYDPLNTPQTLVEQKPEENAYLQMVDQLELIIETMRRNWMEEYHRLGKPIDEFSKPGLLPAAEPTLKPLPGWVSAVLVLALFYLITSWYFSGCAPRMYYLYTPESMPYQPLPDQYFRENPLEPPLDVPLPPADDTVGRTVRLPE